MALLHGRSPQVHKPIIALKAGTSAHGVAAAASPLVLAGSAKVYMPHSSKLVLPRLKI